MLSTVIAQFLLTAPFYTCVLAGFVVARWVPLPRWVPALFSRLIFAVLLPLLLFHLLSDGRRYAHLEVGVLGAFFGGCLLVFAAGRLFARRVLGLDPMESPVFAIGGVFSNNVMLGIPLAQLTLGASALAPVAMVLVFNALVLWTLVTVAVEWSRHRSVTGGALAKTLRSVALNPIIVGIGFGAAWGLSGWPLPALLEVPLQGVSLVAGPSALVSLGMSLAQYRSKTPWKITGSLVAFKLVVHPLVVGILACVLGLPHLETQVVVLLSSLALGSNVYLMSKQFAVLEQPVSQALLLSTFASTLTTPVALTLVKQWVTLAP